MSDMKRLLEAVDKAQFAGEKEGQKPGDQWRGDDKKTPGKKLVGEENVFKELNSHVKENAVERRLKAQLSEFKQGVAEGKFDPINDDDYYEYNVRTKEIVKHISGKHPEARKFNPLQREWPGRDEDHKFVLGLKAKHLKPKDNMAESEYGIPDETPGHLPGGAKMTFGQFKKMWPGVILKRPSGGSLAGSVVADVEGWMNNPKSVWEPLKGVTEDNLQEVAPLILGAAARFIVPKVLQLLPKIANMAKQAPKVVGNVAKQSAPVVGNVAKQGAEIVGKNAAAIGTGAGVYTALTSIADGLVGGVGEVYDDVKDATTALTDKIGDALDGASIAELAASAVKYSIPIGIVLAMLYGGKKVIDKVVSEQGVAEGEKIGGKYDPEEFDAMISRLGQKAKQGPMKTVWDPVKRVYKNVPVNQNKQAVKEYGNAQDPDNQSTTPGAAGSAQQDQEDDMGAKLGAQATNQSINALKAIEPNLNPTLAKQALAKGDMPTTMSSAETGQAKELSDLLGTALGNPQTSSQVTALLRKAAQLKGK